MYTVFFISFVVISAYFGCKKHPKHVELTTKEIQYVVYIALDLNETYITKMYGTTNIKPKCYDV
jgi:hypothetical protein